MTLGWPDCRNARDLGGLPTATGGRTTVGALIRSDNLDRLTAGGRAAFRSAGIARIVDLRSTWECEHYPSPFAADSTWCNRPVEDPDPAAPDLSGESFARQYVEALQAVPGRVAAAVAAIAEAPAGPVVVHCHEGMDRTGVIVGLVLSLVGVERSVIAWDYARAVAHASDFPGARSESTLQETLASIDERGGIEAYLRSGGLTTAQLAALRGRLVRAATP